MIRFRAFAFAVAVSVALVEGCSTGDADDAAKCANAVKDDGELGVDCEGSCSPLCTGTSCSSDAACASGTCQGGRCAAKAGKPCGVGTPVAQCESEQPCELDKDC